MQAEKHELKTMNHEPFPTPRQYFRLRDTRPRKRFGQHFLDHSATAEQIVRCAELDASDTVLEIGPGLGALTRFILPLAGRLHLVELDRDLATYLEENLPAGSQVTLHRQDAVTFDFNALAEAAGQPLVVLGNLPYNITSPLLFHLLDSVQAVKRAVFMVQKEVGARLTASPGTRDYGVLSVLLAVYAEVKRLFTVGPQQFYPPPKVESMVLRLDFKHPLPPDLPPFGLLRRLVSIAFQQRRKTLHNSLKGTYGGQEGGLQDVFAKCGVAPGLRPDALTPGQFVELCRTLKESGGR